MGVLSLSSPQSPWGEGTLATRVRKRLQSWIKDAACSQAPGTAAGQTMLTAPHCIFYSRPRIGRDGRRGQVHGLT